MVKVSASREMTTPWNFILDPLGTDRRFGFCLFGFCWVETCADTNCAVAITVAITKPKPTIMVNDRNLFTAVLLILVLLRYLIDGNDTRHSGCSSPGESEGEDFPHQDTNREFS